MTYNQMTIYMPTVVEVGTRYIQGVNRKTYIENPENNYWYLLEKVYASGESMECRIREIKYDHRVPINRNIIEYGSFQQFFDDNEHTRYLSPIMHAPTYLTSSGASSHSRFYAWKTPSGEYKKFSAIKPHVNIFNPGDNIDSPIPVILLPNGKVIEENLKFINTPTIGFQQTSSVYDTDILLWNLNLAKNALTSNFPDDAVFLYGHIAAFSIQLFGKLIPELFQETFKLVASNNTDYFRLHNIDVAENKVDIYLPKMRKHYIKCAGWWYLEDDSNGRLMPRFVLTDA